MTLTRTQTEQLHKLAEPVRAFLRLHCHPHCRVIIEDETVEVVESLSKTHDHAEAARAKVMEDFRQFASMKVPTRRGRRKS